MSSIRGAGISRRYVLKGGVAATALLAAPAIVRAQAKALKIAVMLPRSGYLASAGQSCHRGAAGRAEGSRRLRLSGRACAYRLRDPMSTSRAPRRNGRSARARSASSARSNRGRRWRSRRYASSGRCRS